MLMDDTKEEDAVWEKVFAVLNFNPSCQYRGHSMKVPLPFEIALPYAVYAIDHMTEEQIDGMDGIIRDCLITCANGEKEWYALDWQHSTFKFHPGNIEEQQSIWVADERYYGGGYYAYFPSFYPDGDYYFFIDVDFQNGYLGHPWRREVWIFGTELEKEIKKYIKNWVGNT